LTIVADPLAEVARFEKLAEASYVAMYDAQPRMAKSYYEDAMLYLAKAVTEAERAGNVAAAERLTLRREHIRNVYNNQFRGVG
jgi:hypothetical protein